MAAFTPFVGSTVRPEFTRRVPAPAFDSMSGAQRTEYLATHPESYTLVTRSPGDGGPEDDAGLDRLIELGAEALDRILALNAFETHEQPAFFLYRLCWSGHVQLGVVGLIDSTDYLDGHVKRHEQVRTKRAEHLSNHFERLGVHSSPIALGYRTNPAIRGRLDDILDRTKPFLKFTSGDGLEQAVWLVDDDEDCAALSSLIAPLDLYIMDGHHRAAAAGALSERVGSPRGDHMLAVLFADDRVNIEPFHRRVTLDEDADVEAISAALVDCLGLVESPSLVDSLPEDSGHIGVYLDGTWMCGALPDPDSDSPLDATDPVRLQNQVMGPILGIDPEGAARRISYFLDDVDRDALVQRLGPREILFVLRAVTPTEVFAVADAGLDMPPKSTYVTPKPRSGVFLHRF